MEVNYSFWKNKRVFVTGHTGFKGGWLSLWLSIMGAKVFGYSLPPKRENKFFRETKLQKLFYQNTFANICDMNKLKQSIQISKAEVIFHLAAQPFVRQSYLDPTETYNVNVMGTLNLLEAAKNNKSVKCVINVTTDKCYENKEWLWPYRENDLLGGHDIYSSSKACSEILTSSYRRSFLNLLNKKIATARAGNVIGGGDWGKDRLIPDYIKSKQSGKKLILRFPHAIRPWQFVLEPLSGYLILAQNLFLSKSNKFDSSWNFGPENYDNKSVKWIIDYIMKKKSYSNYDVSNLKQPHENNLLSLDITKAKKLLNWKPKYKIEKAIDQTLAWYLASEKKHNMIEKSIEQIKIYEKS